MQTELVQNHTRPELGIQLSVQFQLIVRQLIELEQVIHLLCPLGSYLSNGNNNSEGIL